MADNVVANQAVIGDEAPLTKQGLLRLIPRLFDTGSLRRLSTERTPTPEARAKEVYEDLHKNYHPAVCPYFLGVGVYEQKEPTGFAPGVEAAAAEAGQPKKLQTKRKAFYFTRVPGRDGHEGKYMDQEFRYNLGRLLATYLMPTLPEDEEQAAGAANQGGDGAAPQQQAPPAEAVAPAAAGPVRRTASAEEEAKLLEIHRRTAATAMMGINTRRLVTLLDTAEPKLQARVKPGEWGLVTAAVAPLHSLFQGMSEDVQLYRLKDKVWGLIADTGQGKSLHLSVDLANYLDTYAYDVLPYPTNKQLLYEPALKSIRAEMGLPDSTPLEVIQEHPQVLVWSLPPDAGADVCEEVMKEAMDALEGFCLDGKVPGEVSFFFPSLQADDRWDPTTNNAMDLIYHHYFSIEVPIMNYDQVTTLLQPQLSALNSLFEEAVADEEAEVGCSEAKARQLVKERWVSTSGAAGAGGEQGEHRQTWMDLLLSNDDDDDDDEDKDKDKAKAQSKRLATYRKLCGGALPWEEREGQPLTVRADAEAIRLRPYLQPLATKYRYFIFTGPAIAPEARQPFKVHNQVLACLGRLLAILHNADSEDDRHGLTAQVKAALPPELQAIEDWSHFAALIPADKPIKVYVPSKDLASGLVKKDTTGVNVTDPNHIAVVASALSTGINHACLITQEGLGKHTVALDAVAEHFVPRMVSEAITEVMSQQQQQSAAAAAGPSQGGATSGDQQLDCLPPARCRASILLAPDQSGSLRRLQEDFAKVERKNEEKVKKDVQAWNERVGKIVNSELKRCGIRVASDTAKNVRGKVQDAPARHLYALFAYSIHLNLGRVDPRVDVREELRALDSRSQQQQHVQGTSSGNLDLGADPSSPAAGAAAHSSGAGGSGASPGGGGGGGAQGPHSVSELLRYCNEQWLLQQMLGTPVERLQAWLRRALQGVQGVRDLWAAIVNLPQAVEGPLPPAKPGRRGTQRAAKEQGLLRDAKGHFAAAGLEGPLRDVSRSLRSGFRCLKRDPQVAEGIKGMVVAWLEKHKEQLGDPLHFLHPDTNGQHTKAPLLKLVLGMADKYLRPKLAEADKAAQQLLTARCNAAAPAIVEAALNHTVELLSPASVVTRSMQQQSNAKKDELLRQLRQRLMPVLPRHVSAMLRRALDASRPNLLAELDQRLTEMLRQQVKVLLDDMHSDLVRPSRTDGGSAKRQRTEQGHVPAPPTIGDQVWEYLAGNRGGRGVPAVLAATADQLSSRFEQLYLQQLLPHTVAVMLDRLEEQQQLVGRGAAAGALLPQRPGQKNTLSSVFLELVTLLHTAAQGLGARHSLRVLDQVLEGLEKELEDLRNDVNVHGDREVVVVHQPPILVGTTMDGLYVSGQVPVPHPNSWRSLTELSVMDLDSYKQRTPKQRRPGGMDCSSPKPSALQQGPGLAALDASLAEFGLERWAAPMDGDRLIRSLIMSATGSRQPPSSQVVSPMRAAAVGWVQYAYLSDRAFRKRMLDYIQARYGFEFMDWMSYFKADGAGSDFFLLQGLLHVLNLEVLVWHVRETPATCVRMKPLLRREESWEARRVCGLVYSETRSRSKQLAWHIEPVLRARLDEEREEGETEAAAPAAAVALAGRGNADRGGEGGGGGPSAGQALQLTAPTATTAGTGSTSAIDVAGVHGEAGTSQPPTQQPPGGEGQTMVLREVGQQEGQQQAAAQETGGQEPAFEGREERPDGPAQPHRAGEQSGGAAPGEGEQERQRLQHPVTAGGMEGTEEQQQSAATGGGEHMLVEDDEQQPQRETVGPEEMERDPGEEQGQLGDYNSDDEGSASYGCSASIGSVVQEATSVQRAAAANSPPAARGAGAGAAAAGGGPSQAQPVPDLTFPPPPPLPNQPRHLRTWRGLANHHGPHAAAPQQLWLMLDHSLLDAPEASLWELRRLLEPQLQQAAGVQGGVQLRLVCGPAELTNTIRTRGHQNAPQVTAADRAARVLFPLVFADEQGQHTTHVLDRAESQRQATPLAHLGPAVMQGHQAQLLQVHGPERRLLDAISNARTLLHEGKPHVLFLRHGSLPRSVHLQPTAAEPRHRQWVTVGVLSEVLAWGMQNGGGTDGLLRYVGAAEQKNQLMFAGIINVWVKTLPR